MYTEGSLGCGRTVWRSRDAAAAVIPADGCIDVILRGDDVHLAGPSTACIPTSPDVGETIGIRFDPGLAAGVLRFNPAEVRDLAAPLRDVVGAVRAAEVARVLRALRSFGTAPGVDLLTSPADGWVGLVVAPPLPGPVPRRWPGRSAGPPGTCDAECSRPSGTATAPWCGSRGCDGPCH